MSELSEIQHHNSYVKCKPKIMIVDDNTFNLMPLRMIIKNFVLDTDILKSIEPPLIHHDCKAQQQSNGIASDPNKVKMLRKGSSIKDGVFIVQIDEEDDDDDLSGQDIKSPILEERIQVDEAINGVEAVQLFTNMLLTSKCEGETQCKGLYKLIIMDLQMPEMDGFQSTETILSLIEQNLDKF